MAILTKQQEQLQQEKQSIEEKFNTTLMRTNELELVLNDEKLALKPDEKSRKNLLDQQLGLEQEKASMKEMYNKLVTRTTELEIMLESEKISTKRCRKVTND